MSLNPDKSGLIWVSDLTGGLNDTDAPQDLAANQCQIAQNVEWITTRFAQRRQGGSNGINVTEPWGANATLHALMRHTPTANETAAELWAVDSQATPVLGRLAAGNTFTAVTVGDAWTSSSTTFLNGASLNGKFFIAGNTAVDRLHVWDGTAFRRVGLATTAAPTVADTGLGTYAATLRYYKVHWLSDVQGDGKRVGSELTPAVSFTPSGTGTHARVTRPTAPGEHETLWQVFGSPDGVNYYALSGGIAVATTTYDDNVDPLNYSTAQPAFAGYPTDADYFTTPMSPKYVLADEDRLVLLSSWETASAASAVMWTPIIGTTPGAYSRVDEERVPSGNRLDLDRQDGGGITGGAVLAGTIVVFKLSQIYRLARTGDAALPYQPYPISKAIGAVSHKSIVLGEDASGQACLYFLSTRGPYRLGASGLEYLGRDIETLWGTVNLAATPAPFGVWHQAKRQVQWWVTTGAASTPTTKLVFHVRHAQRSEDGVRGGWATHTEGAADALCACMFANTLGATMSLDLKPYVGQKWTTSLPDGPCIKYDADSVTTDRGALATTYVARVKTAAFPPGGAGEGGSITRVYVLAKPTNRTLGVDLVQGFGVETRPGVCVVPAASGTETRVGPIVVDDTGFMGAYAELVVDDEGYGSTAWTVDAVGLRAHSEGPL